MKLLRTTALTAALMTAVPSPRLRSLICATCASLAASGQPTGCVRPLIRGS